MDRSRHSDLIIMGARGLGKLAGLPLGSTARIRSSLDPGPSEYLGLRNPPSLTSSKEVNPQDFSASLAYLPRFPENHVKITVKGDSPTEVGENLRKLERLIREKLQGRIIAADREGLEEVVGHLLRSNQATLAVAESCTGGLVAHRLTQIPGSSDYFERSLIVYSNAAKTQMLQVPESLIAAAGAVSAEVAEKMAEELRRISHTTLGLAITGIAGPTGGSEEKPVGTVFIALASPKGKVRVQGIQDIRRITRRRGVSCQCLVRMA